MTCTVRGKYDPFAAKKQAVEIACESDPKVDLPRTSK